MLRKFAPHTLLRIADGAALLGPGPLPRWVSAALRCAPWVVVRRARAGRLIPVGVRGAARAERFAAWIRADAVQECLRPAGLAARRRHLSAARGLQCPALAVLDAVDALMREHGLNWGPCGSVGFELASGVATVTAASDLDLTVETLKPLPLATAVALSAALAKLPVRLDVQLEGPHGAVALAEYAAGGRPLVLRTVEGPRLVDDPWVMTPAAA
jgi:phosphoribosyl-dephospho-CoA transferase